ncbi:MAG: protein-L-isoaspartate(D-aspartate) O-methyltransferase [Solirubrobacteraceae bacterium]
MNPAQALAQKLRVAIGDERVLAAIAGIPRDRFVPAGERKRAYENVALPIACEQTISQPLVVARMLETVAPRPTDRVLDVGTGSGYHAALLARLCAHVWTIERHSELSRDAEQTIRSLGIENVTFVVGDGWAGLPDQAPFDAINVAAAVGDAIPRALQEQLSLDGRLVAPVGDTDQHLVLMHRTNAGWERRQLEAVRFVPLVRGEAR